MLSSWNHDQHPLLIAEVPAALKDSQDLAVTDKRSQTLQVNARDCLICGRPTRYVHMGVIACRACALFHKRMLNRGRPLVCRTGSMQCSIGKNDKFWCKKCRFDRLMFVLSESKKLWDDWWRDCDCRTSDGKNVPAIINIYSNQLHAQPCIPIYVINSVKKGYALMNTISRMSELSLRKEVLYEKAIAVDGMTVIPTTIEMLDQLARIFVTTCYEFASVAFPEFNTFSNEEQAQLVQNFFAFIKSLDSAYRMHTLLPDRENISMGTYSTIFRASSLTIVCMCFLSNTTYMDNSTIQDFIPDSISSANREDATKMTESYYNNDVRARRMKMKKWNPTEDEFIAFVGLSFWSLEKVEMSDRVHQIADKYRAVLLAELRWLYRERMNVEDYAGRLGDGFMFLNSVQSSFFKFRSRIGVLKLMGVVDDSMLFVQLYK